MTQQERVMGIQKPPFWVVLRAHAKADPRKTGLLIVLTLVMVVVYVWTFWKPPASSEAAPVGNLVMATPMIPSPATLTCVPPSTAETVREKLAQPLHRSLVRDPFAISHDMLRDETEQQQDAHLPDHYDTDPLQTLRELASDLELESTICGTNPLAHINGRIVLPGEDIAGFTLKSVEPHRVILHRDGIRVSLHLK